MDVSNAGSSKNSIFNYNAFRKKRDLYRKLPPLYKNLANKHINPQQIFVRPFSTQKTCLSADIFSSPSHTQYSEFLSPPGQRNEIPTAEEWQRYYPSPNKEYPSTSSLFLSSSELTSLLEEYFNQSQISSTEAPSSTHRTSHCHADDDDDIGNTNSDTNDDDDDDDNGNDHDTSITRTSKQTSNNNDDHTHHSHHEEDTSSSEGYATPHNDDIADEEERSGNGGEREKFGNGDGDENFRINDDNGKVRQHLRLEQKREHADARLKSPLPTASSSSSLLQQSDQILSHLPSVNSSSKSAKPKTVITLRKVGKPSIIKDLRKPSIKNYKAISSTLKLKKDGEILHNDQDTGQGTKVKNTKKGEFPSPSIIVTKRRASLRSAKTQRKPP